MKEVLANLYQGSVPTWDEVLQHEIGFVIALAPGLPMPPPAELPYMYWPIHDGPLPDIEMLAVVARCAEQALRADKRVLIHCAEGINRSSLVVGVILNVAFGLSGRAVVTAITNVVPNALANTVFREYLETLEHRPAIPYHP